MKGSNACNMVYITILVGMCSFVRSNLVKLMEDTCCSTVRTSGPISDCSCDYDDVNSAVHDYYVPLLANLTSRTFFRYFRVDLERSCPFWDEDGSCTLEGCSVGVCENEELPANWLMSDGIYSISNVDTHIDGADTTLGDVSRSILSADPSLRHLDAAALEEEEDDDDSDEWTDMPERLLGSQCRGSKTSTSHGPYTSGLPGVSLEAEMDDDSVYVNLLANPEGYTGYTGPSAWRVWRAIQRENCFSSTGDEGDQCTEKRIFYRLMSGLQASISTHIAKEYYFDRGSGEGSWGHNIPHFVNSVGSHPNRLTNMYFSFVFVLRAVVRGCPALATHNFNTGDVLDDTAARALISELCTHKHTQKDMFSPFGGREGNVDATAAQQCRIGFDETSLFSGDTTAVVNEDPMRWDAPAQQIINKGQLREDFRNRFRNISRIMDCVSCERCRVWGKLQILGLGTAIKLLLAQESSLQAGFLTRQEVIALINTLHQLSRSVDFAAGAARLELEHKINLGLGLTMITADWLPLILILLGLSLSWAIISATCSKK